METRQALVTGASRGIGLGIAQHLAANGYDLTITSRSEDALQGVAGGLRKHGNQVHVVAADMSREDDIERVLTGHASAALDVIVLAAGVGSSGPIDGYPMRRFDKQHAVNLRAPFLLLSKSLPLLREAARRRPHHGAKVIALASIGGVYPEPGLAAYGAAKAALVALCQSVNAEECTNGVSACAISPGYVDTDMSAWVHDTVPPDTMIRVSDVVTVVEAILNLSAQALVPHVVMHRASDHPYRA